MLPQAWPILLSRVLMLAMHASFDTRTEFCQQNRSIRKVRDIPTRRRRRRTTMPGGPVNIYEYEALAHERLPKPEYDFIAGGATDEITLKRTRAVFDAIMLRPRMLVDISQPNLSTT